MAKQSANYLISSSRMQTIKNLVCAWTLAFFVIASSACNAEQATTTPEIQLRSIASNIDSPLPAGVDPQTGYRMHRYRSAVPTINPGTEVVSTARAFELHQSGQVIFIDVYPPRGMGADPLDGSWIISEDHANIANSVWLPEVGRGHVEQTHQDYFKRNLRLLSKNNKNTPLLFYCTADCWQSWNAARRALQWGYNNIFWYPDGTDGWTEDNHSLVPAEPVNFLGQ